MNDILKAQLDVFYGDVKEVLKNKVEEFHDLGYKEAKEDEVWACLMATTWRKQKEDFKLHQVVNDILLLTPSTYMVYIAKQMHQSPDWLFKKFES